MSKKEQRKYGLVYSTGGSLPSDANPEQTSPQHKGPVEAVLKLEKKGRGGKTVTVIELRGASEDQVKELGRLLKRKAGVGGTTKGTEIELQGDQRDAARDLLKQEQVKVRGM